MTKESESPAHVKQFTSPDVRTTTVTKNDFSGLPDGGTPLSPAEHRIDPFVTVGMQPSDNHALPEVVPADDALDYAIVDLEKRGAFGAMVKRRKSGDDTLTCFVLHPYRTSEDPESIVATYVAYVPNTLYGMTIVDEATARAYNGKGLLFLPGVPAMFSRKPVQPHDELATSDQSHEELSEP